MTIKKIISATTYAIAVAKFMTQAKKTGSNVIDAVDSLKVMNALTYINVQLPKGNQHVKPSICAKTVGKQ